MTASLPYKLARIAGLSSWRRSEFLMLAGLLMSTALVGLDLFGAIGRGAPRQAPYVLLVLAVVWYVGNRRKALSDQGGDVQPARGLLAAIGLLVGANGVVLGLVLTRMIQTL